MLQGRTHLVIICEAETLISVEGGSARKCTSLSQSEESRAPLSVLLVGCRRLVSREQPQGVPCSAAGERPLRCIAAQGLHRGSHGGDEASQGVGCSSSGRQSRCSAGCAVGPPRPQPSQAGSSKPAGSLHPQKGAPLPPEGRGDTAREKPLCRLSVETS